MSEETMPAAEAAERNNYELAFHVLPTVVEGEVSGVFDAIKALITTNGGELTDEEAPERFELAYEVVKHIDTKNRKFKSAYFGWVRFSSEATAIEAINEAMHENSNLLRYIMIKLTKAEEADAFRFHEALAEQKVVTVDAEDVSEVPEKEKEEVSDTIQTDAETEIENKGEAQEVVSQESAEEVVDETSEEKA